MKKTRIVQGILSVMAPAILLCTAWSQTAQASDPMAQKTQAFLAAEGKNAKMLHSYQWIESTTTTIDGNPKPPRQTLCSYNTAGGVIKTPLGAQPEAPKASGGPLKRHITEKKIEEVQESMAQVNNLAIRYLGSSPDTLQTALRTKRVSFERGSGDNYSIVINDYVKQGDKLILDVNNVTMALRGMHVRSYLNGPDDPFAIDVQYALLPDGAHYPSIITVSAPEKKIALTTTQSGFFKPVR